MSHTPGPWVARPDLISNSGDHPEGDYVIGVGERIDSIAVVERLANARLIAAAPELYEAARLAIDALDLFMGDSDLYEDDTPEFLAMQALSAAIAKAEGRS